MSSWWNITSDDELRYSWPWHLYIVLADIVDKVSLLKLIVVIVFRFFASWLRSGS